MSGRLHLVIGPVGAGKTTFCAWLCRELGAVGFDLDRWMATLYGDDPRPTSGVVAWYLERRDRCLEQLWQIAEAVAGAGVDAVLEPGLVGRDERARFYRRIDDSGCPLSVYLLDAPREVRRERVIRRNSERGDSFSRVVPAEIFELASDMWQPPDDDERAARAIRTAVEVEGDEPSWWLG